MELLLIMFIIINLINPLSHRGGGGDTAPNPPPVGLHFLQNKIQTSHTGNFFTTLICLLRMHIAHRKTFGLIELFI